MVAILYRMLRIISNYFDKYDDNVYKIHKRLARAATRNVQSVRRPTELARGHKETNPSIYNLNSAPGSFIAHQI